MFFHKTDTYCSQETIPETESAIESCDKLSKTAQQVKIWYNVRSGLEIGCLGAPVVPQLHIIREFVYIWTHENKPDSGQ